MRRELLRAGGGVALVRLAGMAAGFALTVALAQTLGAEGLGLYSFVLLLIMLACVPVGNGWATLLLRSVSRARATSNWSEARGIQKLATGIAAGVAALVLLIGLAWAMWRPGGWFSVWLAMALAGVLLGDQLTALRLAALRGLGHPVWGQLPETLLRPGIILVVFLVAVAVIGNADVKMAFGALFVASVVSVGIGAMILRYKSPSEMILAVPTLHWRPWSISAGLLATNSGLVILNSQLDFLILGLLAGTADLGHYRVAIQIALVSGFGYVALNMIAAERFAHLFAVGDKSELQSTATFLSRIAFVLTLPMPILFFLWGEPVLGFVFGPGFEEAWTPTLILLAVQSIRAAFGFSQAILLMSDAEAHVLPATVFAVVSLVLICIILVPTMGPVGAALGALIGQTIWNLALTIAAARSLGLDVSALGLRFAARKR